MVFALRFGFLVALILAVPVSGFADEEPPDFTRDVRPILAGKCWNCHGPDENTREADLRLDQREFAEAVLKSTDQAPAELVDRIQSNDPDLRMPPASTKKPLTAKEIDILTRWVKSGAEYEGHWAFVPPQRPETPQPAEQHLIRNPIDQFVLSRLEKAGLSFSPEAKKETLIRRVSLDLTGIPPTISEVEDFLSDKSPFAYEKLIDRLLASPRYGEHMAAKWLDVARYADTDGYQNDRYRYMHVWRDWVILSLNANQPYDEFITEQIAGDLLPHTTLNQQIASGFCRNHRINSEDGSIPAEWHVENVVDRVDTLGTAILGLTIGCARCHDHKYDPISAREYYQLFAYFNNVPEWGIGPNNGNSPPFIEVPKSWPNLAPNEIAARTPEPLQLRRARKEKGNGLKRPQPGNVQTVMVMHEMDTPRKTYLLERGQFDSPDRSEVLVPTIPEALNSTDLKFPQNRLGLAEWLVHPQNPLTARVAVNRAWQQFFGVGLVKTPENFGLQGELPSHPQLLDWLAVELRESGWNMKRLQKRILMSATYRQSSRVNPEILKKDPDNRLLSRGPRFRVHPFVLRDMMLANSGLLVEQFGGLPTKPYMPPKIWSSISNNRYKQDHGRNLYRRSLYTFWRRTIPPPTMMNFNAAAREVCIVRTDRTNTPLQALTLMNNQTFMESARFLAERMLEFSGDRNQGISHGFHRLTGRLPSEAERALLENAYREFLVHYKDDQKAAQDLLTIGEAQRNPKFEVAEHAAMTMTASLMMNLDEALTKE